MKKERKCITGVIGGRLPVRFVLKDYHASVPENTPPGSVILTAGVNKIDPVSGFFLTQYIDFVYYLFQRLLYFSFFL